jgi:signal transduction histidine kinase
MVAELFEATVADAVRSYVDARDREARRMRASAPRVAAAPAAMEVQARVMEVALGELLTEALGVARTWAEDKGIPLLARFDPEVVLRVDPMLTVAALKAVLGNAVKFTDEGGVTVEVEDRPEELVVYVRDNCDGISPEELATVFEPFPRRHSRKPGNGVALAIARRALTAQGGAISASSDGEHGCAFALTLPKARH